MTWEVIRRCGGQVRSAFRGAYGLDFGAILAMGSAMGADIALLADLLPSVEPSIVAAYQEEAEHDD